VQGRTYGCHVAGCIATALGARFRPYYAAVREVTLRLCAGCDDGAIPLWKRSLASYALQTQCIAMAAVGRAVSAEDTELAFGAASDLVAGAKAAAAYADEEPHAGLRALSPDERVWKHRARLLRAHLEEVHHLVGPSVARLISALGPDAVRGVAGILPVVLESAGREVPVLKVEAAQLAGGPAEDASGIDDDASEGSVDEEEEDEEEDEEEEEEEGDGGWAIHRREKPAEAAARLLGVDLNQAARSKELNEVYYLSAEGAVMRVSRVCRGGVFLPAAVEAQPFPVHSTHCSLPLRCSRAPCFCRAACPRPYPSSPPTPCTACGCCSRR